MLAAFSYGGLVASTLISTGICIIMSFYYFIKNYQLKLQYTFRRFILILIGCAAMSICAFILFKFGLGYVEGDGRILTLIKMAISGLTSVGVYFGVTYAFGLPQLLLNLDLKKLVAKIKG
jgi:peptidoglycan biosynthesis protein MviN/MurJ (putative lipid II flippase)